jgi:hypothetical protein
MTSEVITKIEADVSCPHVQLYYFLRGLPQAQEVRAHLATVIDKKPQTSLPTAATRSNVSVQRLCPMPGDEVL